MLINRQIRFIIHNLLQPKYTFSQYFIRIKTNYISLKTSFIIIIRGELDFGNELQPVFTGYKVLMSLFTLFVCY